MISKFNTTLRTAAGMLACIFVTLVWLQNGQAQLADPLAEDMFPYEGYFFHFNHEPKEKFDTAQDYFLKNEMKLAAADIREAIAFMKLQEARATVEGKKALIQSTDELTQMAHAIENGTLTDVNKLGLAFENAHFSLALHHYRKAAELLARKDAQAVRHDLEAAALNFEQAVRRDAQSMEPGCKVIIDDTREAAQKLSDGIEWIPKAMGKSLLQLTSRAVANIEKLKKQNSPADKGANQ